MSFKQISRILFFGFVFLNVSAWALEVPKRPEGYVSDYAGILSPAARTRLEEKLHRFEQETSNQVIVVTFLSLEGEALEDFSIRLAEAWKIGQKRKDNGVILLVFKNDRQVRIEVGYGLEGALTDATSKSIIENEIVPRFRQGSFEEGIEGAAHAIMAATQGEYRAQANSNSQTRDYLGPVFLIAFFLGTILPLTLLLFLCAFGIFLMGFGIFVGPFLFFLPFGFLIGIFPLLLYFLFGRHRRLPMILGPRSYRGNNFFGGSGGFDGGGLGGGGGSFGGGGASGRW